MWHTPNGERVLKEHERNLFLCGSVELAGGLALDGHFTDTGVNRFDRLDADDRVRLLFYVSALLISEAIPCETPTALTESAVAAVYAFIRQEVCLGFDESDLRCGANFRRLVIQAARERGDSEPIESREDFETSIEQAQDQILWDADFELVFESDDEVPPALRISNGYFSDNVARFFG